MKIDYLSDLHLDYYFRNKKEFNTDEYITFFKSLFKNKQSDILIIAGDLGHYNEQIIFIMKEIIRKYFYKYVVCVLGNHDYYLTTKDMIEKYKNSFNRVKELREKLNNIEGVYCLNGNVIEIENIKFGGCDGWYDNSYLKTLFPNKEFTRNSVNEMWINCLADYDYIYGIKNYDDILKIEIPKVETVYKNCDIMITHINPSIKIEHTEKKFARTLTTTFFKFNGEKYLKDGSMKYWIYGHTHLKNRYEDYNVNCLCNPVGLPYENLHFQLDNLIIN